MRVLIFTFIFILLSTALLFAFLRPEYRSAFEADQECHFQMSNMTLPYSELGCDHDLETRQWILFDSGKTNEKAEVLKRFRY